MAEVAPQVAVRNTFLCDVSPHSGRPRSMSMEPPTLCDRYEVQVHALMFRHQAVCKSEVIASQTTSPCSSEEESTSVESPSPPETDNEDTVSDLSQRTADRRVATSGDSTPKSAVNSVAEYDEEDDDDNTNGIQLLLAQEGIEALLERVPAREDGSLTSVGSIVHEDGTCKPCVFAHSERKKCQNGIRCVFCHFAHPPKRRMRFCKKKRLELRRIADQKEEL